MTTRTASPTAQLNGFLAKFTPEVTATAKATLAKMRLRLPGATELVYDNYNALAIGFSSTDRASGAIFSIAVFPRWVSLFFLQDGPDLPDPRGVLRGGGTLVRHVRLTSPADLDAPPIRALMAEALRRADPPLDTRGKRRLIIKSVSKKHRPRRAAAKKR
jgi:hypothetical protein